MWGLDGRIRSVLRTLPGPVACRDAPPTPHKKPALSDLRGPESQPGALAVDNKHSWGLLYPTASCNLPRI